MRLRALVLGILAFTACGKKSEPAAAPATTAAPTTPPPETTVAPEPDVAVPAPEPDVAASPEPEPDTAAAPSAPTLAGDWCIVLGSARLDAYDQLVKSLADARANGFPEAGIYDARDFTTFTWGDLVLVGAATADKDAALTRVQAAAGKKPFVKECPHGDAKPLASAADIAPPFLLSTAPVKLDVLDKIFGWSDQDQRLVFVATEDSIQAGGSVTLDYEPTKPEGFTTIVLAEWQARADDAAAKPKLDDDDAATVKTQLERGAYIALDGTEPWVRALPVGGVVRWRLDGEVAVSWKRASVAVNQPMAGSWHDYTDTFTVSCGEQKLEWLTQATHDDAPKVSVGLVPAGPSGLRSLVLTWSDSWGIEGDHGGSSFARAFDLRRCTPTP